MFLIFDVEQPLNDNVLFNPVFDEKIEEVATSPSEALKQFREKILCRRCSNPAFFRRENGWCFRNEKGYTRIL